MKTLLLNMKIRTKLIVSYIAIILFAIALISFLVYSVTRQAIIRNSENHGNYLSEQLAINLSARFKAVEELQFSQFSYSLIGNLLAANAPEPVESTVRTRKIYDFLKRLCYSGTYIDGVCVIDRAGNSYVFSSKKAIDTDDYLIDIDTGEIAERRGRPIWSLGAQGKLLMSRQLIDINSTRGVGYIVLQISPEFFTSPYKKNADTPIGSVVLFDGRNNVLPSGSPELDEVAVNFIAQGLNNSNYEYGGDEYVITRSKLPNNDFSLLYVLSVRDLNIYTRSLPYTVLAAAVFAIVAALLAAGFISRLVSGSISALAEGIKRFASGSLSEPVKVVSNDEIGFLTEEFNKMTADIDRLINDIYDAETNKKNAELNALQFEYSALESKINPHFIYNTLESVNSLAKMRGANEISEIVCLLGSLLRDNVSSPTNIITLEKEFENIQKYINLQKLTYGNKFEAYISIDEGLNAALVPKFILQPLVENAIKHGILASSDKGIVTLQAEKMGGEIRITLTDNGAGIANVELDKILDYSIEAKDEAGTRTKVGVRAVDKRLKILYGNDYGLKIKSAEGSGTEITVAMPLTFNDGGEKC